MSVLKFVILVAASIVVFNFVASFFGWTNPILNRLVTVILSIFVAFELFRLGQLIWGYIA
ncbi:MAG: hypothetical protein SAL07_21840 [Oscillatoria sp. PMC 1051.18]|nr:hypothetical protein [Oscillatoria sp. PMC 1050.18]MEC5032551.1 hypothetical protein [Oscillatoria sp. PMC 1051.18]